jgi:hypothetical protein
MPISFLLLVRLVDKIPFAFIGLLPQLGSFLIRLDFERLKSTLCGHGPTPQAPYCPLDGGPRRFHLLGIFILPARPEESSQAVFPAAGHNVHM